MRRLLVLALALLALSACDGSRQEPTPTPVSGTSGSTGSAPPSSSSSVTPTASPTPEPSPPSASVKLPADAPRTVDDPAAIALVHAGDLTPLVPPGATVGFRESRTDQFAEVAFTWRRGDDPFAQEQGFVIWQRSLQAWAAVYAFTDKPAEGVLGISVQVGELTDDGVDEYLTFEQTGGSGACGTWRVITSSPGRPQEVFDRTACDTDVRIVNGALEVREAVYEPGDPHCCPSAFLTSTFEWDGEAFVLVSSEEIPAGG